MKMFVFKKQVLSIILILILFSPNISSAAIVLNLDYPKIGPFDLNVNQDLNQIVAWFYYFIVSIAGIAAFFMLIWGGFEWLTSAGSPARIADAKDRISSAILGLLLILVSFLILQVINPELVMLNLPQLK